MLIEVRIPLRHNTSSAYAKVERRVGDWAVTAAGASVTLDGDAIARRPGGPDRGQPRPRRRWRELAARWSDSRPPKRSSPRRAGGPREACEPVTDVRGTAEYKRHLASELTIRTLRTAAERVRARKGATKPCK